MNHVISADIESEIGVKCRNTYLLFCFLPDQKEGRITAGFEMKSPNLFQILTEPQNAFDSNIKKHKIKNYSVLAYMATSGGHFSRPSGMGGYGSYSG